MIGVNCFLIGVVLWLGTSVAGRSDCDCRCGGNEVCDEFDKLRTDVDFNIAHRREWNRNVETSMETLRKDIDYLTDADGNFRETVTNDLTEIKDELLRFQSICSPVCENGGRCVKNVCNCTPAFTGVTCEQAVCNPPCENGGKCLKDNICDCTPSFIGDRCEDAVCSPSCENGGQCVKNNICICSSLYYGDRCEARCGVDFKDGGGNRGERNSGVLVWPWMAAVYSTSYTGYACGGSLIHRHFVLTSASCVDNYGSGGLSVKLGLSDLNKQTHLKEYRVRKVHRHPQFTFEPFNDYDYDMELLETEEPIPFGPFVRPVCLPPREISQEEPFNQPQSSAHAVYLREYISSPHTASPLMLNLTIYSKEKCRRKIEEKKWDNYFSSPDLALCAESSSTACPKWGSPLMQSRVARDGTQTWTQVGIESVCLGEYFFSPRLENMRAWMDDVIATVANR